MLPEGNFTLNCAYYNGCTREDTESFYLTNDNTVANIVAVSAITGVDYTSTGISLGPENNSDAEVNAYCWDCTPVLKDDIEFFKTDPEFRYIMTNTFEATSMEKDEFFLVNNGHNESRLFAGYFFLATPGSGNVPPPVPPPVPTPDDSVSGAALAAILSIVALILLCCIVACICKSRKRRQAQDQNQQQREGAIVGEVQADELEAN